MKSEKIQQLIKNLPHLPGVYKYFNKEGELIYVGKAKDLRKRVTSYFTKEPENRKTYNLVQNIHHLEFTIVNTEQESLLLEDSLIKHFQPRYNINLKDDKSFPYIVITNEAFPRVFLTRNLLKDGSEYFGPFTSAVKVRELLELIRSLIPLRKHHQELFIHITEEGKLKVSPEYYLKNANQKEELLTEEEYNIGIQQVRAVFKGKFASVIKPLRKQMKESVEKMDFEKAEVLHQKIEFIQQYRASGKMINAGLGDIDVFTILIKENQAFVNYLQVKKGTILQTKTFTFKYKNDESQQETLISAIFHIQKKLKSKALELIVPFPIEHPDLGLSITVPKKGVKKKLLNLSIKNLIYFSERTSKKTNASI